MNVVHAMYDQYVNNVGSGFRVGCSYKVYSTRPWTLCVLKKLAMQVRIHPGFPFCSRKEKETESLTSLENCILSNECYPGNKSKSIF